MSTGSLKDIAYNLIKEKIITCTFVPGEFINEVALSNEIGVSRTPIREALNSLERENLVKVFPKKGVMVTTITIVDINEIYQVRALLEPYIIRHYAKELDKNTLQYIREQLLMQSTLGEEKAHYKIDTDLHQILVNCNRNRYFAIALDNVYDQNQRLRVLSGRKIRERLSNTRDEHIRIIEHLLVDAYEAAAVEMVNHLERSREAAVRSMLW